MASECSASSVYEEYDPLDFLYGETEMRDTPVYATISKKESPVMPSPPPKSIPTVPAVTLRSNTVSNSMTQLWGKINNFGVYFEWTDVFFSFRINYTIAL